MAHYTQRAELVFQLAKNAARKFKHPQVYPVHILLGLFQEDTGISAHVLKNRGFTTERIEAAIMGYDFGTIAVLPEDLPWTEPAQFVSQEASMEAQALGHNYVGTEHVFLAMTKISAHQWLSCMSASDLEDIRREALSLLGHYPEAEEEPKKKPTHEEILAKVFAIRDAVEQLVKDLQRP